MRAAGVLSALDRPRQAKVAHAHCMRPTTRKDPASATTNGSSSGSGKLSSPRPRSSSSRLRRAMSRCTTRWECICTQHQNHQHQHSARAVSALSTRGRWKRDSQRPVLWPPPGRSARRRANRGSQSLLPCATTKRTRCDHEQRRKTTERAAQRSRQQARRREEQGVRVLHSIPSTDLLVRVVGRVCCRGRRRRTAHTPWPGWEAPRRRPQRAPRACDAPAAWIRRRKDGIQTRNED